MWGHVRTCACDLQCRNILTVLTFSNPASSSLSEGGMSADGSNKNWQKMCCKVETVYIVKPLHWKEMLVDTCWVWQQSFNKGTCISLHTSKSPPFSWHWSWLSQRTSGATYSGFRDAARSRQKNEFHINLTQQWIFFYGAFNSLFKKKKDATI